MTILGLSGLPFGCGEGEGLQSPHREARYSERIPELSPSQDDRLKELE